MTRERPSRTALKIARFMVLLDAVPRLRGVLPEGQAELTGSILRASEAVSPRLVDMMRRPATIRIYELMEAVTGRGQLLWFGLRKRWFAERVEAEIEAGARQLLVLGAGFDPLAAWIAERHPDVHCVEIDAPATAEPKRHALQALRRPGANHEVCAADLATHSLADALQSTSWRHDARSVVVAEGLLMYLTRADVERLLTEVTASVGAHSRLACSCVDAHANGAPNIGKLDKMIRFSLRLVGEPMQWGIRPPDVPAFFAANGHRVLEQPTVDDLRSRYLVPMGLADDPVTPYEHLVLVAIDA